MLSPSNFIRWKKPKPPLDPARAQTSILSNSSVTSRRFTASQSQKTERPAHYGVSNLDVAPAVPSPEQLWSVKYKQETPMATATTSPTTDYHQEWFEIEDATYLNAAGQAPMPKVSHRAVQAALEWKKNPHHMPDSAHFEGPNRIRASIAELIGGKPEEIALTTGARTGMSAGAYGLTWKPGDDYKCLLVPYGGGFFWFKNDNTEKLRPGPFNGAAEEGAEIFNPIENKNPKPVPGARRWDMAETSNYFNFAAMDASLQFVLQLGPETVEAHNRNLIDFLFERLPKDRCVPTSPLDSARRGPYGCFAARSPEKTAELYHKLAKEKVITSLREGNIRVSPHVYNSERDIDRLIAAITL